MWRRALWIASIGLFLAGFIIAKTPVEASPRSALTATPTFNITRLAQPPTAYPPRQADNGEQIYWGLCSPCHGDRGQGLTVGWRDSYAPDDRDCWQSGCHGNNFPDNSFKIPETGAPALAGPGKLTRFSNAFELQIFIQQKMPFFPTGSLTSEETFALTAFILKINGKQTGSLELDNVNSAAIPIHHQVSTPGRWFPGILTLAGILILATAGLAIQRKISNPVPGIQTARPGFLQHLHPPTIPAEQSRFRYTLGSGGLAVYLIIILIITGLMEMYYYIPTPAQAAISVETITTLVPFGSLVRNLHFWSAQFLVIIVTIHLLRVTLTGAYAPPRRFNYLLGLGLLILVLLLDFTGYMLRWDDGIRWALIVGTNLLKTIPIIGVSVYQFVIGSSEPGASTLARFYTWHIFGLTLGVVILVGWHIFRLRRDGGIAVPAPTGRQDKRRISRYELFQREVMTILIASVVLLLFALVVPAPIEQPFAGSNALTGDSRAPWFFIWIQQLLKLGNPFLFGVLTPILVVVVLALLPYVLPNARHEELGRWFTSGNRMAQVITVLIILLILIMTIWGAFSP